MSSLSEILQRFDLVASNVSLEQAEVVCLGEEHETSDIEQIAWLIQTLFEKGNLVLIEDSGPNSPLPCFQRNNLSRLNVPIEGWDSEEASRQLMDLYYRFEIVSDNLISWSAAKCRQELDPLFGLLPDGSRMKKRWYCDVGESEEESKASIAAWINTILPRKAEFFQHIEDAFLDPFLPMRNRSMTAKIEASLVETHRVFVVAGSLHFEMYEKSSHDHAASVDLVHAYLQNKKYVILRAKRP